MAEDTETLVDPAATAQAAPVAIEPTAEPAPPPSPAVRSEPPKWALERIAEERQKGERAVADAQAAREAAERRASELEAIIQRMQAQPGDAGKPSATAPAATPPRDPQTGQFVKQDEFDSRVRAEAERQLFVADCTVVGTAGTSEFKNWPEILRVLDATKANNDDCLKDVIAVDKANAHKLLAHLAEDGERAVRFANMPSRQRIVELTRMSQALQPAAAATAAEPAKAAPAPSSRAPAPKPVLSPAASPADIDPTTPEGNDKLDDKAWEAAFKRNPAQFGSRLFGGGR